MVALKEIGRSLSRLLDLLFVCFLLSHIPITLFVDAQAVLPTSWFPNPAVWLGHWYLSTYRDPLMLALPTWFRALCVSELALQLPFFFVGAYGIARRRNWVRIPAIIYGSFVVATMVPILAELAAHEEPGFQRGTLLSFYAPYLLLPAMMVARFALGGHCPYGGLGGGGSGAGGKSRKAKAT